MKRVLLIAAMSLLVSAPAFSQNAPGGDGKDSSSPRMDRDPSSRMDRDLDDILRTMDGHGGMHHGGGGAAFFLRSGDAVVAVRCDPQDSTKACVDATLTLLERAKAAQTSGGTQGGTGGAQPPSR